MQTVEVRILPPQPAALSCLQLTETRHVSEEPGKPAGSEDVWPELSRHGFVVGSAERRPRAAVEHQRRSVVRDALLDVALDNALEVGPAGNS